LGRSGFFRRLFSSRRIGSTANVPARTRRGAQRSLTSDLFTQYPDGFVPASQFSGSRQLRMLYEASCWSYGCIVAQAAEISSLGAQVQRRQEDGRWIRAEHRELQAFLDSPTGPVARGQVPGSDQFTWPQLMRMISCHLDLDGNA
jgi:hypothetical protein